MKLLLMLALVTSTLLVACGSDTKTTGKTPSTQASPSTGGVRPGSSPGAQSTTAAQPTPAAAASAAAQPTTDAPLSDGNAPGIPALTGDIKTDGALRYIDEKVGDGASPATGQHVKVQYTGWLTNGTKFDSSRDRNLPFDFVIGTHSVIQGWDTGVATMKVGGKRRLIIPAALGYGARGSPPKIPANATLIFDVELLSVQP